MPKEINIICVGDVRYRFDGASIRNWDFNYNAEVLRIDFLDGGFVEFYRHNILCVEFNTEDTQSEATEALKQEAIGIIMSPNTSRTEKEQACEVLENMSKEKERYSNEPFFKE